MHNFEGKVPKSEEDALMMDEEHGDCAKSRKEIVPRVERRLCQEQ